MQRHDSNQSWLHKRMKGRIKVTVQHIPRQYLQLWAIYMVFLVLKRSITPQLTWREVYLDNKHIPCLYPWFDMKRSITPQLTESREETWSTTIWVEWRAVDTQGSDTCKEIYLTERRAQHPTHTNRLPETNNSGKHISESRHENRIK
jgi:hypothetical protein